MAPKSGEKKLVGTIRRSTRKVVTETVSVEITEGESQEATQEGQNEETQELIDAQTRQIRTIPVHEKVQEEEVAVENIEVSLEKERKRASKGEEDTSGVEQEEEEEETQDEAQGEAVAEEKEVGKKPDDEKGNIQKKKRKRRGKMAMEVSGEGYKRYVFMVLKQVHPELRVSSMAMSIINSFMKDIFERLADEAAKLAQYTERATLSAREIEDAVKLVLPGELGKHAIAEGSEAVKNYASYDVKRKSSNV